MPILFIRTALLLIVFLYAYKNQFVILNPNHCEGHRDIFAYPADTTIHPFEDRSYVLLLKVIDTTDTFVEHTNAVLFFYKTGKKKSTGLFRDSIYSMFPGLSMEDLNNDGIKDIVIFHSTGARANPTYYLYIRDSTRKKLIRVKGFEELPNPSLDTKNNIIVSVGLSGNNYYSFYRIAKDFKLIDLGHAYQENPADSTQYDKAISQIVKQYGNK